MYHNGQIVYCFDRKAPVAVGNPEDDSAWAWSNIGPNTTHFIEVNPKYEALPKTPSFAGGLPQYLKIDGHEYRYTDYHREQRYSIALPKSVEEATELLAAGLIVPAPRAPKPLKE